MVFSVMNEQVITFQKVPTIATAIQTAWFKAPRLMTIKNAYVTNASGVITANTTTYLAMALMNGGTVGTSTLTICTFGSVATPYIQTARQGYAATFDTSGNKDLEEGEWVVVEENSIAVGTGLVAINVHAVYGTGRTS